MGYRVNKTPGKSCIPLRTLLLRLCKPVAYTETTWILNLSFDKIDGDKVYGAKIGSETARCCQSGPKAGSGPMVAPFAFLEEMCFT